MNRKKKIPCNLFLIGFMGTGKSTVARYLAGKYDKNIVEMDEKIEEEQDRTISSIFAEEGEEYFRDLETELLKSISLQKGQIISCGGGVPLRKENVDFMKKSGKIVLLTALPHTIYERTSHNHNRPLLQGKNEEQIEKMMEKRRKIYEDAADIVVSIEGKRTDEIADEIINKIL